jgi:hypothetical protein
VAAGRAAPLNHAVAVSMVAGPRVGLELVERLRADTQVNADRRFHAVRGHFLEMAGDRTAALEAYRAATRAATNLQQQRYLNQQVTRLQAQPGRSGGIMGEATSPGEGLFQPVDRASGGLEDLVEVAGGRGRLWPWMIRSEPMGWNMNPLWGSLVLIFLDLD